MFEKQWQAVPPQAFTANGGVNGLIQIADSAGFKVKASVVISATGLPNLTLQCKRVLSKTQMIVGPLGQGINKNDTDLSAYTVALGAFVYQDRQPRVTIAPADIIQAVYDQEPAVGIRTIPVDEYGNYYTVDNPLPVDAEITVDNLQLLNKEYDTGEVTYPSGSSEVYTTYVGGYTGTPVQQITINYTDSTKNSLLNWQRANWNGSSWVVS